jgi:hypothetical protein
VERELSGISLRIVQNINGLHNAPDAIRFASVNSASRQELYTLMVYGEEEIFTSSFNGLFTRLIARMQRDNIQGDQLLQELGYNKFRTFIKLCAGFNRLNEFLSTMDKGSQEQLLKQFASNIEQEKNMLEQATTVADAFSMIQDPAILKVLQETIRSEYERVKASGNKEAIALYGLLAGMFGQNAVTNRSKNV